MARSRRRRHRRAAAGISLGILALLGAALALRPGWFGGLLPRSREALLSSAPPAAPVSPVADATPIEHKGLIRVDPARSQRAAAAPATEGRPPRARACP